MIHSLTQAKRFSASAKMASKVSLPKESNKATREQKRPTFEGAAAKFEVAHEIIQLCDRTHSSPVDRDPRPDFVKTGLGDMKQHPDGFTVTIGPSGERVADLEFNANSSNGTITVTEYSPPGDKAGEPGGTFECYTLDIYQKSVSGYTQASAPSGLPANASSGDAIFGKPSEANRGDDFKFSGDGISSGWSPDSEETA